MIDPPVSPDKVRYNVSLWPTVFLFSMSLHLIAGKGSCPKSHIDWDLTLHSSLDCSLMQHSLQSSHLISSDLISSKM